MSHNTPAGGLRRLFDVVRHLFDFRRVREPACQLVW